MDGHADLVATVETHLPVLFDAQLVQCPLMLDAASKVATRFAAVADPVTAPDSDCNVLLFGDIMALAVAGLEASVSMSVIASAGASLGGSARK